MLEGFPLLEKSAKENGFKGILFESNVPVLRAFCTKRLGFDELLDNWLIKAYNENS